MSSKIGKIAVGTSKVKKSNFDYTHDVNTTSDIGFLQPTCYQIIHRGDSTITYKGHSRTRLMPMFVPVFGEFYLKQYAGFVRWRDLYQPFEELMTGQTYSGSELSYIPEASPSILISDITKVLLSSSICSIYSVASVSGHPEQEKLTLSEPASAWEWLKGFLHYDIWSRGKFEFTDPGQRYGLHRDGVVVTPAGSDYMIRQNNVLYCFKFDNFSTNLYKVIKGLGYVLDHQSVERVSVLPLFAYFKVWFDALAPKQSVSWQNTAAARVLAYMTNTNDTEFVMTRDIHDQLWWNFFKDLGSCYYVCNPDWFTAHIDSTAKSLADIQVDLHTSDGVVSPYVDADTQPYGFDSSLEGTNPVVTRALQLLLKFVNRDTVLGQNLVKKFAAHGYGSVDDNKLSCVKGTHTEIIPIDDLFQTATTEQGYLGEFGGRGFKESHSDVVKVNCDAQGIFIVISTYVPRAGYVDGLDMSLTPLRRMDYYQEEFDGMTYEVTPKSAYLGSMERLYRNEFHPTGEFGYIPLYSGLKYHNNILNGNLSMMSTRAAMAPYTLDRLITNYEVNFEPQSDGTYISTIRGAGDIPQASPELRYLGKYGWLGNFNRAFMISGQPSSLGEDLFATPLEDNFLLHIINEVHVFTAMKPMSISFDTDIQGGSMKVEKA